MPFIKGRFHINPIAGQALESAREAEAALLALEHAAQQDRLPAAAGQRDGYSNGDSSGDGAAGPHDGPIHRVEIEASELVPSHSGRAVRGFVARVHRQPGAAAQAGVENDADSWRSDGNASGVQRSRGASGFAAHAKAPETHVFADHRDLVSFLRDEFAKDCK